VALRIQRLHWYPKVSGYFDRRGQTSHPGRRPARFVLYRSLHRVDEDISSELTLHAIEVSITHVEEMGTSVVGKLSQELTAGGARTGAVIWRRHDELETTAGPPGDTSGRGVKPSDRDRL
jgi:hypothetical protein